MNIGQQDEALRVEIHAIVRGVAKDLTLSFKLNEPLHYTGLDGDDYRSTALWQRNRLVIRSIELEKGKRITSEEIWSLTEDGKKLISEKREDGEEEHSTCTSTFEKSGETTASAADGRVQMRIEKDRVSVDIRADNNGDTYSVDRPVGLGRNSYRGPAKYNLDSSLSRRVRLSERMAAELRVESTNVINRNNYLTVNRIYGNGAAPLATFLAPIAGIANTNPSRQFRFGVRLLF